MRGPEPLTTAEVRRLFWWARKRTGDTELAVDFVVSLASMALTSSSATTKVLGNVRRSVSARPPLESRNRRAAVKASWERRTTLIEQRAASILTAVAERHGIDVEWMLGRYAPAPAGEARDEATWLLRRLPMSFPEVAIATGRKDHTSAMDGVARTEARIAARPALRAELLALGEARPALRSVG